MARSVVLIVLGFAVAVFVAVGDSAAGKKAPKYVGASSCKTCHKAKKKGNQYAQWAGSKHANAYKVLATDKAKKTALKAGVKGDPQKAPECLKCHVTGYGSPKSRLGKKYSMEDGVGCESCHGAGGNFKKKKIMKDHAAAVANGLIMPNEKLCKQCHNKQSPTFKPFDYAERVKEVDHPLIREK
jgi:hypothetical protein